MKMTRYAFIATLLLSISCASQQQATRTPAKPSLKSGRLSLNSQLLATQVDRIARSHDGRWLAYVVKLPGKTYSSGAGDVDAGEIWLKDTWSSAQPRCIVRHQIPDRSQELLALPFALQFAPDGDKLYFSMMEYATDGIISCYDLSSDKQHEVTFGCLEYVVQKGPHSSCLVATQHRYFATAGSYDFLWLLDPHGTIIGPVADSAESVELSEIIDAVENREDIVPRLPGMNNNSDNSGWAP